MGVVTGHDRPLDAVFEALEERDLKVKNNRAQCPAHDDNTPSLSITEGEKGVILKCHGGCDTTEVVAALGLTMRDLFYDSTPPGKNGDCGSRAPAAGRADYVYQRADGTEFAAVVRRAGKRFHQSSKVGEHWESGGCAELNTTPYRLPEVIAAVADGRQILVVEGERDVETARELGLTATCSAGGAGSWKLEHTAALAGADVMIVRDRDDPGRAHAEKVRASLHGRARSVRVVDPVPGHKGADLTDHVVAGHRLADLIETTAEATGPSGVLVTLADVTAEPLRWLWAGRLPVGKLVTLDGDPSLGKSTLAVTFAAHISTGTPWPDGAPCETGNVVLLSAEDGMADTIRPRLDAAGGDPARVHVLTAVTVTDDGGETTTRPPNLGDVTVIRNVIEQNRARLLVVDVLMAYMPGKVDSHRDQDVRTVLYRLAEIAERTGCTILLLRHLNKTAGGSAMYRGGGSIGIVGAARAGYLVAPDPDNEGAVVFASVKSNLAMTPESLTYRLESAPGTHVARVAWTGGSAYSAEQLLGPQDDAAERDDAVAFIETYLSSHGGKALSREVVTAARKEGFSRSTVYRASERMRVTKVKDGMKGPWYWHRPDDRPPEDSTEDPEGPSSQETGSSGPSRDLRDAADDGRAARTTTGRCRDCDSLDTTAVQGRGWFCPIHI